MYMISTGRIYKIINRLTTDIYIGSTFSTLNERWRGHKKQYNQWLKKNINRFSIYDSFKKYGFHNHKIILIKEYLCYREHKQDFKHLHSKEQLWINKMNCINESCAFNPIPLKLYQRLYNKQYKLNNKEKIKEYDKKYRLKNNDKIKEYYQINKDKIKEYQKEYYENKIKKKITCSCGSKYIYTSKSRHLKTKKHQNFINNQNK